MAKIKCPKCGQTTSNLTGKCDMCLQDLDQALDAETQAKLNNRAFQVFSVALVFCLTLTAGIYIIYSGKHKTINMKKQKQILSYIISSDQNKQLDTLPKRKQKRLAREILSQHQINCRVRKIKLQQRDVYNSWNVKCRNGKRYKINYKL